MRQKLSEGGTYSKPYARVSTTKRNGGLGTNVRLWLSVGACVEYGLKEKEKVDLFWDRDNEVWNKPILIVKRGGTQRSLNAMGRSKSALCVQMKMFVHQFKIPIVPYPLPILDYIDNEIWIDFSGEREKDPAMHKYWEGKFGKRKRHTFNFNDTQLDVRSNSEFIDQCKVMAASDGGSLSALVLRLLAAHMEDTHPRLWHQLLNSIEEG